MPITQSELYNRIVDINRQACHDRGLSSSYGYNAILNVDLTKVCMALRKHFAPPIRILDIGCGTGAALHQLAHELAELGVAEEDFEFWGMGLNRYDDMAIDPSFFIPSGLNAYQPTGMKFHLVVSVFSFHYMWHKLEGLEKIHNQLLVEGGLAYLHFPGYLVRFDESPASQVQDEVRGNHLFPGFLAELESQGQIGPMDFRLVPYCSDDDDCFLLAEFGVLHFEKRRPAPITFGRNLKAFALFTHGFNFERMNDSPLTYVASYYTPKSPVEVGPARRVPLPARPSGENSERLPPYRIISLPNLTEGLQTQTDVAIHPLDSDTVVIICPGACEPLAGNVVESVVIAEQIQRAGLGAVVRYSDPYDHDGGYPELLLENLRLIIELTLGTARNFCATATPRLCVMAYSSSAGAIAAIASEYDCIQSLLLVAPSFDVPREVILPGFSRFEGEVYVIIGDADNVVLPQQAFWFYEQAEAACRREYVEVPTCGHNFERPVNKSIFIRSPLWAFGDQRPRDFPESRTTPSDGF